MNSLRMRASLGPVLLSICCAACTAQIDGVAGTGNSIGPTPVVVDVTNTQGGELLASDVAQARARRLSSREINNSIRSVFLPQQQTPIGIEADVFKDNYDNQYETLSVSLTLVERLQSVAEEVGAAVASNLGGVFSCDSASVGENPCAGRFIDEVGLRAFRRPLDAAEKQRLLGVYEAARGSTDFKGGLATVVEALIQSPYFIFRTELGEPTGPGMLVGLTSYEIASELSYLVWGGPPDDELLRAAGEGGLTTAPQIDAQLTRILADPRARPGIRQFFLQWLDLGTPELLLKNDPESSPDMVASMLAETGGLLDRAFWEQADGWATLLTSNSTTIDARLSRLYGVSADTVTLPLTSDRRIGVFTQPAFLSAHTRAEPSPIFLGKFFRNKVFCQTLAPPPPGAGVAPAKSESSTTRERFAQHSLDPSCSGCHRLMDPIGLAFEQYDVMGRFIESENGTILTGQGSLDGTDVDGPILGVAGLANSVSASRNARECFAGQMLKYALGRETAIETARLAEDQRVLDAALASSSGGTSLRGVLSALAQSSVFRFRSSVAD